MIDIEKMLRDCIGEMLWEIKEGRALDMKLYLGVLKSLDAIEKASPNLSTIKIKEMRQDAEKRINKLKELMKENLFRLNL